MSPLHPPDGSDSLVRQAVALCARFEKAWQRGDRPDLDAWMTTESPVRRAALLEMACIDLEYRLHGGEPARVEHYLGSYPDLRNDRPAKLRLVATEARIRVLREPDLDADEYLARFSDLTDLPGWSEAFSSLFGSRPPDDLASTEAPATPEPGFGETPPLVNGLRRGEPRLQLKEEIGRGGMGVIYRGREPDLARDVAVKVLLEKHAGKLELIGRFCQEAQVAGGLQHPSILPVYQLGALSDGRPFFTMKLIQGRTLTELLNVGHVSDVPGTTEAGFKRAPHDRSHLLSVFAHVCQALAYAHSKGIVHRDLKPANIMVGAFGEVQVMDWGLAKVLGDPHPPVLLSPHPPVPSAKEEEGEPLPPAPSPKEGKRKKHVRDGRAVGSEGRETTGQAEDSSFSGSATQTGVVLGTPAYMAPEQARGEVGRIDARADVFGLGAILCEILTGKPPFPGRDRQQRQQRAADAELADAFTRLDACGAEEELVLLAKRCLAAHPAERPADASVLATEVTAYLESVEARLRQAELERAQAQVKAGEERKRRKVQLALAGVLLLLVAVGGLAGWWLQQRRQTADLAATRAMDDAKRALQQAVSTPLGDAGHYREAVAAARQAEELARTGGASAGVRQQAVELLDRLSSEAESASRDRALLSALLEVRSPREGPRFQQSDQGMQEQASLTENEQFAQAFRAWGVDVDDLPTAQAAALLRTRPPAVVEEVIAALDEWSSERRRLNKPEAACRRPAALAEALDEAGGKRSQLRAMLAEGNLARERAVAALAMALRPVPVPFDAGWGKDRTRLRMLAAQTDPVKEPVLGLVTLVRALRAAGYERIGEDLLRSAVRARPHEVVLHHILAQLMWLQQRWREAVESLVILRAVRPGIGAALAEALLNSGRVDEGLALFERMSVEQPDNPWIHFHRGKALIDHDRFTQAADALRQAIRLQPTNASAHIELGRALAAQGEHHAAEKACRRGLALQSDLAFGHTNLGIVLDNQGRHAEAEDCYRRAIDIDPALAAAYINLGNALNRRRQFREGETACRRAIALRPDIPSAHYNLANSLIGQRRYPEAVTASREAIRLKPDSPEAHTNLGIALFGQGKAEEAEPAYRAAIKHRPNFPKAHYNLGNTLLRLGRYPEAEAAFRQAIRLRPDYAEAHCNLSNSLEEQGRFAEALDAVREGDRLGRKQTGWKYPSDRWVRQSERFVELDRLLPRIRDGTFAPSSAGEGLELASMCQRSCRRLHHAAVHLAADAFASEPKRADDLRELYRYNAACSAVLAAAGQAADAPVLPDRVMNGLRRQALTWLRADLALYVRLAKRNEPKARQMVLQRMTDWQKDDALASVRDRAALDRLSEDERACWLRLWNEVEELRKEATTNAKSVHAVHGPSRRAKGRVRRVRFSASRRSRWSPIVYVLP